MPREQKKIMAVSYQAQLKLGFRYIDLQSGDLSLPHRSHKLISLVWDNKAKGIAK